MKRLSIAKTSLAACAAVMSLTACGSTDSPSTPATATSSTTGPAATTTSGGVTAQALCDYLRGELPKLQAAGGELAAMTKLTVELFNWYDKQGAVPNGVDMDTLTLEKCPDVRTAVLKTAGVDNFSAL